MTISVASEQISQRTSKPRVLMLLPGYYETNLKEAIAAGQHPAMDYVPLRDALKADVVDYRDVETSRHPFVKAAARFGRDAQLAVCAFLKCQRYDVLFSYTDTISLPLAAMLALLPRRPLHIVTAHSIASKKRGQLLRQLHPWVDLIIVYSDTVYNQAYTTIGVPKKKLYLSLYHTDHHFFKRTPKVERHNQICSVGLEKRDYPTLLEATHDLDLMVHLTAFSPWSKDASEVKETNLPANVTVKRYDYSDLRQLYAESRFLVLSLYENEYAAGITALYEAMAMGCPAIVSRTTGLQNMIEDGINGVFVPPGDPKALRQAILGLLGDPERAARIGENGYRTVIEQINIDAWTKRMVTLVDSTFNARKQRA